MIAYPHFTADHFCGLVDRLLAATLVGVFCLELGLWRAVHVGREPR